MIKKIITILFILILLMPSVSAYIQIDDDEGDLRISMEGDLLLAATFKNTTLINEEKIAGDNFTTKNNTFPYESAYKVTYRNNEGKTDYIICFKTECEAYLDDYPFADLTNFYSGYLKDNKTPFYIEIGDDYVYGFILDCKNITYNESSLVHDILGKNSYALSTDEYPEIPQSFASGGRSHYQGVEINPYDLARNDPYSYYDYFDYEDNVDIDEYLYDGWYDE